MWIIEMLSVALFAMGWWPCCGCPGFGGPGINDECNVECTINTTPDEITMVVSTGATALLYCTDAQCDEIAGTYILPPKPSVNACSYVLDTGTMRYNNAGICGSGTPNIHAEISRWTSGPDVNKKFLHAEFSITFVNIDEGDFRKTLTTSDQDCCGEMTPAATLPWHNNGNTNPVCDYSGTTVTLECT